MLLWTVLIHAGFFIGEINTVHFSYHCKTLKTEHFLLNVKVFKQFDENLFLIRVKDKEKTKIIRKISMLPGKIHCDSS